MPHLLTLALLFGQIYATAQPCYQTLATCYGHTLAIKPDGTLWAWGANANGQLGDGTTTPQTKPIQIGLQKNWKTTAVGAGFSLAIKTDGTLWAWGTNRFGELGSGNPTAQDQNTPIQIGTDTNWLNITANYETASATKTNGTLWAWGFDYFGGLGVEKNTNPRIPTQIGRDTNWKIALLGRGHTIALKTDGTLWSWGNNSNGALGNGGYETNNKPTQIGADTHWKSISTLGGHNLALKTEGTLWAWGWNNNGQIGNNTTIEPQNTPLQIGSDTNWQAISAGYQHSNAIKTDGTLWTWGLNFYGQLGTDDTLDRAKPTQIGKDKKWKTLSSASIYTYATSTDNSFYAWGGNLEGIIGNGNTKNLLHPTPILCPTTTPSNPISASIQQAPNQPASSTSRPTTTADISNNQISIYPNPTNGIFTIQYEDISPDLQSNPISESTSLNIYNLVGELLFTQKITQIQTPINLINQPSGTYLLVIDNGKTRTTRKLIIER
jgi:trimeric autotransporter adhesin